MAYRNYRLEKNDDDAIEKKRKDTLPDEEEDEDDTGDEEQDDEEERDSSESTDPEDDDEEDKKDKPQGRPSKAGIKHERQRCARLLAIEKQAQSLGARFNAQAAINKRLSIEQAQQHVLDALVEASRAKTISPYANTNAGEISQSKKLNIWKWKKGKV